MHNTNSLLVVIILGTIEGLTEFLPISSTGHMIIVEHLLWFKNEAVKTLEVVIQLGSTLALVVIFRQQLFKLINIHFNYGIYYKDSNQKSLNIMHIIVGIIPIVILGLIFYDIIKSSFNPNNVMYALIAGSLLLIIAEYIKYRKKPHIIKLEDITYCKAFVIGCFQCLALWPGFSRSGATISGGILIGMHYIVALEFSFLLAIPTTICAVIFDIYKSVNFITINDIPTFTIGFITAFIMALLSTKTFLWLVKHISFISFAIYRFIIAIIIYIIIY